MTRKNRPVPLHALALGAVLLALAACGGSRNPTDVDSIDRRAVERWQYLIDGKAELAWDYLTPGARAQKDRDEYAADMNNRPVRWTAARFVGKDCDEERCAVQVEVDFSLPMPRGGGTIDSSQIQNEVWLRLDEGWFFYPNR